MNGRGDRCVRVRWLSCRRMLGRRSWCVRCCSGGAVVARCGSWRSVSGRVDATNGVGVLQVVSSSCMYSPECIMVDDARVEAGGVLSVGVACCVQYCVFWVSR